LPVAAAPADDGVHTGTELTFDLPVRNTIGTQQNDAGPEYVPLWGGTLADNGLQPLSIARPQLERRCRGIRHDGTSMFTFESHASVLGSTSQEDQHSRTIHETRY
jgi:hypothetical protein